MATLTRVPAPRSPRTRRTTRTNAEMYGWVFMRVSGVVLVVLILGHLLVNLVLGDGISQIDFAFVAGKYTNPVWQVWSLLMLWLAMIHGANGIRTIINDYAERDGTRIALKSALYLATVVVIVLGTLVIFTFEACPPSSPAELLPAFCEDV